MTEEEYITFTEINDFLYSPASLYLHGAFRDKASKFYKEAPQIAGSLEHEAIEEGRYSTRKKILQAKTVYCEKYGLLGKIDILDVENRVLIERKNKVSKIYLGLIYQTWAQYFALREHLLLVRKIFIYSKSDNKKYQIKIPTPKDEAAFAAVIEKIRTFKAEKLLSTHTDFRGTKSIYHTLAW